MKTLYMLGTDTVSYLVRGKTPALEQFLERVTCLPWGNDAATHFATVAAALHRSGTPIGTMDAMIAGHALARRVTLVTNNLRHFERVVGLSIENWAQA